MRILIAHFQSPPPHIHTIAIIHRALHGICTNRVIASVCVCIEEIVHHIAHLFSPIYTYTHLYGAFSPPSSIYIQFETTEHGLQTLPGLQYLRPNCISECRQQTMVSSCNCSLDFIFPTGEYPQCNASALKCLYRFDGKIRFRDVRMRAWGARIAYRLLGNRLNLILCLLCVCAAIFNYEIPPKGNKYFEDDEIGMMCNCMPECELIDYGVEVSPIPNPAYRK